MELRLAEIEFETPATHGRRAVRTGSAPSRVVFVTYAVEIEGEAPLIFIAEAVDD